MPIPDYKTLMLPVLKLFADGKTTVKDFLPFIEASFNISEEESQELMPSGSVTLLSNRAHWARTYLSNAGLLESPKRNYNKITPLGEQVLATKPDKINGSFLDQFDELVALESCQPDRDFHDKV
ncbi:winged helix-turn-helix domain-containing protein [Erythrobacter sp. QSSC1-22B]|uniref:winged helix-turn-helix domain-containing protein n=1 Tax=Erythrobacter sp. QSSC1-22B TaxID=1860125 RepID=UPI0009F5DD11|nr:winged helix-turn-helix domain-containing protein [Erythrobacter sp. QSSC1-22B]